MRHSMKKWILISILLNNLNDRFKKYVTRIVTQKQNFIFEKIVINLQKLKRINKRDQQTLTFRAQSNDRDSFKKKSKKKSENFKKKSKKCFKCENNHFINNCWYEHSKKRSKWVKQKIENKVVKKKEKKIKKIKKQK